MITLNKILDSARKSCSRDSDAAVAEALKVSRQTVMQWRSGARRITDEHLMAAIELGRLDPALAVLVRQEMAETKAEKKAWSTLWDRLSAAAAVLMLVVVAAPSVARANPVQIQGLSNSGDSSMYIMFKASPRTLAYRSPQSPALLCQAKKPASPACPSRPGSYGFLHRPIRVLYMTQAIQPQTKPTPATMISSSSKAAPFSP